MSSAVPSSSPSSTPTHRFSPITQDDHAGYLWIATLLAAVYAVLSILVRGYIKRKCFGADDWICSAATVLGIGTFIAIFVGLSQGLGKSSASVDALGRHDIGESVFAGRITWVVACCLAKCSVILLIRRLFSDDMVNKRSTCNVVLAIVVLWGLGSIVAVSARCDPHELLQSGGHCSNQLSRWAFINILDAISELLIFLLSFGLIWGLQMSLDLKVRVIIAFIFRLPIIAVAIIHIVLIKSSEDSSNLSFVLVPALICEQVELGYSLLSATIPNLKSFITSFHTAMMMDVSHKIQSQPTSIIELSSHTASSSENPPRLLDFDSNTAFTSLLRPETELRHIASIQHDEESTDDGFLGDVGLKSHDRIIRRDIRWTVEESFK